MRHDAIEGLYLSEYIKSSVYEQDAFQDLARKLINLCKASRSVVILQNATLHHNCALTHDCDELI